MLLTEELLTFTQATKRLPKIGGKRPHASSIWRWARKGVQGVRLECRKIGGRFVTSAEALERFTRALAEVELDSGREDAKKTVDEKRARRIGRARESLKRAGI